jgi:hypothetical protein
MTQPRARDPIYRRRRFEGEIIELCVRWYISYGLSYRDLVAMMAERGLNARRHRAGASNSKAAVLIRPRPSVTGTVIEASLGPSFSLEVRYLIRWNGSSGDAANAPEPITSRLDGKPLKIQYPGGISAGPAVPAR